MDQVKSFQECFPVIPDLLELELLEIAGEVYFDGASSLKGRVKLKGVNKALHIEKGRNIENKTIEC